MKKLFSVFFCLIFLIYIPYHSLAQNTPHFNHTTIYVVDLQKGAEFYEKVMMLEKIAEPFHDNRHTWFKAGEHSQLHVVQGASAIATHDVNIHLAFSVPSLDDFMKHLDDMGIKYGNFQGDAKKIALRPDGIKQIYLQDPDGYWIEVNDDKY